jgi:phosphoribosylformylglycinamidine synthase
MASKRWIWEQYDRHVMGDTVDSSQSGGDAAIVRIHGTNKALAICSDCNPHYVAADPYEGGKQAVAEAYRNLSAVGATPIAITDNLNFGNPEKPDTMGVIVKAIEGMAEACRALDFPVVSGNVSLYNETDGVGIPPTPVVGGIGLIEDVTKIATLKGAQPGDALLLVGDTTGHIGASAYARTILGLDGAAAGSAPHVDLAVEQRNATFVRELVKKGRLHAAHDVSEGGIACAATEMALASGLDAALDLYPFRSGGGESGIIGAAFGEDGARYLLAVPAASVEEIIAHAKSAGVPCANVGDFSTQPDGGVVFNFDEWGMWGVPLSALRAAYEGWLPTYMSGEAS